MIFKVVTVALWAAVAGVTVADAQTLGRISGPAELPPAGFKGQMFVDSRGCIFLRAGYGGTTNWVARVSRDRKPLCGYPSTMATLGKPLPAVMDEPQVKTAAAPTPAPAPSVALRAPMNTVASLTTAPTIRMMAAPTPNTVARTYAAAPVVMQPQAVPAQVLVAQAPLRRAPVVVQQRQAGPAAGQIGCFTSAPVPRVMNLAGGGQAVMCTRGDGTLDGMRAPIYNKVAMGEGNRVGAGLYNTPGSVASRGVISANQLGISDIATVVHPPAQVAPIVVPKGYKLAWSDDRLNPNRARGSALGQAQQDQVWTRDVPATLVADQPVQNTRRVVVSSQSVQALPVQKRRVTASTMTAPRAPVAKQPAAGTFYIQVGTFGVASNAEGTKARLRAAGMPVGFSHISKGGKALQIVFAGPFGDSGAAQSALGAVRGAGFGDAFIR